MGEEESDVGVKEPILDALGEKGASTQRFLAASNREKIEEGIGGTRKTEKRSGVRAELGEKG